MSLSARTVETLLDLVEIKLSCMEIYDRDDARELQSLEQCRRDLLSLSARPNDTSDVATAPVMRRSRGRPRLAA